MIRKGDLILSRSAGFVPWMICALTRSYWSHVAWVISDTEVVESHWRNGVRKAPISQFKLGDPRKCKVVRITDISEDDLNLAMDLAILNVGKPYDYRLVWNMLLLYLGNYIKAVEAHEWKDGYICSELIAKPLKQVGFTFRDDKSPVNISPADIDSSEHTVEVSP